VSGLAVEILNEAATAVWLGLALRVSWTFFFFLLILSADAGLVSALGWCQAQGPARTIGGGSGTEAKKKG
jgi:hypothetical protein